MARKAQCLIVVAFLVVAGLGCSTPTARAILYPHADAATLGQNPHEHQHQVMKLADHDRRALIEDLDLFFQTDRPTRLTRWHVK